MFIETHNITREQDTDSIKITFLRSNNVQAFPCGRRRSDSSNDGTDYCIPFDPEARLNTEANHRKHSSLNGFTQSYLKEWDAERGIMSLAIAGYSFKIKLDKNYVAEEPVDYTTPNNFGNGLIDAIIRSMNNEEYTEADMEEVLNSEHIYANIRIKDTLLFSDTAAANLDYNTSVLHSQSIVNDALALDLLKTGLTSVLDIENPSNYYFSGLSFSTEPITACRENIEEYLYETESEDLPPYSDAATRSTTKVFKKGGGLSQQVISLRILDKVTDIDGNAEWKIHQPALLPKIEHGDTENSVKMGSVTVTEIRQDSGSVPSLKIVKADGVYQLQFSQVDEVFLR